MRTKTMLVAVAAIAASVASTMAQSNVYSLNVVGYVNTVLTGGSKYTAVANPLNTTNNTLAGLFGGAGTGLPAGSQVLKYSTAISDYVTYGKVVFGTGWTGGGATVSLNPGEGCMIFVSAPTYTNTFVGEVLQGNRTNAMVTGYQLVGNTYPDSGLVTSLQLTNVPNTSQLLKWNVGIQDFDPAFGKVVFGSGWTPSVPSINVGEAVFINAASPFNWVRTFTVQ